ncbi:hypothetical protein EVAR_31812_1 [Eumeta japonica]|uniref:Uncharacterized protein n=1 Tax=Eumeta variegata TaxID=151549 RepID=A0A4C1W6V8_EUMVA|nr:hypothetical protein EVAR_31812_1 [Eumeta japonica]
MNDTCSYKCGIVALVPTAFTGLPSRTRSAGGLNVQTRGVRTEQGPTRVRDPSVNRIATKSVTGADNRDQRRRRDKIGFNSKINRYKR